MIDTAEQLILLSVALFANALSAMAGGGAGLLQLPALIFLGLPFSIALATHKIATVALGAGATLKHSRERHLQLNFALLMLGCGLPGVILGARVILDIPEYTAKISLGILTIGLGIYSYLKKQLGQNYRPQQRNIRGYIGGGLGLFLLGFFNGSLTSGTGLFVTMWLIAWFGFDYKRATAYTMILVGLFWNGTGALTLAMLAEVQWDWLPMLLLGSIVGGYWGAHIAVKYGNPFIKRVFEAITVLVGLSLILHTLFGATPTL
ncbi:sulfite exporter TauE/SafE family protein [Teredinibacter waterburyi]|uniref:sulfite exporter TauE/SafE family protein n=1 Tax=Teredinibacter waterburyi TaxID=1500538 RepID=UPI00165ED158|nr:sulfite exporter TauE/SafE family protein [Teredinibacter waterburyi]